MPMQCISPIPYRPDSAELFAPLADEPWSVWLDSGRPAAEGGRYDIMAARPYISLVTRGEYTEVCDNNGCRQQGGDPLHLLRELLGPQQQAPSPLPFVGGAIGYFSYDLARRLERLDSLALDDSGMPEMVVGIYDWAVVVDHERQESWLVSAGRSPSTALEWDTLLEFFSAPAELAPTGEYRAVREVVSSLDRERYTQAFARIQHYLREGDCYQVNFAQRYTTQVSGSPWDGYRRLRALSPVPHGAFLNTPFGQVLSASPERFVEVRGGRVRTEPIKGTRPRGTSQEEDAALARELQESEKDRAENLMIVDLLRNDIGKCCRPGSVQVPELFALHSFATVHHLISTITGELIEGCHALDLLRGCFPGGSITGAPKLRAMQIIEELEGHRRGLYCGAIGYLGFNGDMDTSIVIRTLVQQGSEASFWAGGGIVIDSDVDAEYAECRHKAEAILRLLKA